MGLLYKFFGIRPTTVKEFYADINKHRPSQVTIKVGVEEEWFGGSAIPNVYRFMELESEYAKIREYLSNDPGTFAEAIGAPGIDTSALLHALKHRSELANLGIKSEIVVGDKTLDSKTEEMWLNQARKLSLPTSPQMVGGC